MSGYTPGPWEVREHKFDGLCVHAPAIEKVSGCDYRVVENVNGDETPEPTYGTPEANARLIAAAPELLEVARRCEALLLKYDINAVNGDYLALEHLEAIGKVIAKATGEQA